MGPLSLSPNGPIYIDANVLIYSIERVQPYVPILDAFWQEVAAQRIPVLTSELTVLEVLVGQLKAGDTALETLFRRALFSSPDLRLLPVPPPILARAAHLRATLSSLRTPNAIHAAAALASKRPLPLLPRSSIMSQAEMCQACHLWGLEEQVRRSGIHARPVQHPRRRVHGPTRRDSAQS